MSEIKPIIAILGGTGGLGTGLARRWVQSGYPVIIGSRTPERAEQAAADLEQLMVERGIDRVTVRGLENSEAAKQAEIIVLTVPFSHHADTLKAVQPQLHGKILIDTTVPLVPPKVSRVQLPEQGSAGQIAQSLWVKMLMWFLPFRMFPHRIYSLRMSCIVMCWCVGIAKKRGHGSSSWWRRQGCEACTAGRSKMPPRLRR